ncbi:hypothetical protein CDL15_Pgr022110 [Punica granatum]|uniref:Uncharacterized protein n=1 Tax=Punica granatum TaxID=22663 RepID=A0A218VS86_PUNGR|nr:hypothetical protein CDL15_Pgr022110 [Punica granatum]
MARAIGVGPSRENSKDNERSARLAGGKSSGAPIWRHTESHAFRTEGNARLPNQRKKGLVGKRMESLPIGWTVGAMIYFTGEVSGSSLKQ